MHDTGSLAGLLGLAGGGFALALLILLAIYAIVYLAMPFYIIATTNRLTDLLAEVRQLRKDMHDLNAANQQRKA